MTPSTASRHLGAAKVLDLLTAIDRTRARYFQISGPRQVTADSAGRVRTPNRKPGRHTGFTASEDAGGCLPHGDIEAAPLFQTFHAVTDNAEVHA